MADTYHIKIKKDYAVAVIEDLQKMDAVELLPNNENEFLISDWQIELGREEVKKISENPALLSDWEKAKQELKV
ncbi:MAG TPA: hypothetical protein VIM07_08120 [Chitinophagaceae bacterium]